MLHVMDENKVKEIVRWSIDASEKYKMAHGVWPKGILRDMYICDVFAPKHASGHALSKCAEYSLAEHLRSSGVDVVGPNFEKLNKGVGDSGSDLLCNGVKVEVKTKTKDRIPNWVMRVDEHGRDVRIRWDICVRFLTVPNNMPVFRSLGWCKVDELPGDPKLTWTGDWLSDVTPDSSLRSMDSLFKFLKEIRK